MKEVTKKISRKKFHVGSLIARTPQSPYAELSYCTGEHGMGASGEEQMLTRLTGLLLKTTISHLTWEAETLMAV